MPCASAASYYRARYYDLTIGRFLSEDPLEVDGGDVNFYRYVWDNPTDFFDPVGEWGVGVSASGSAEAGAGAVGAGATGSAGGGIFFKGLHPSAGGFYGGGAMAGGPGWGKAAPKCPNKKNGILGAFVGGGVNIFVTNASKPSDLAGPFKTYSLNVGWGVRVLTIQFSTGTNSNGQPIDVLSYGGPLGPIPTGGGYGASISTYNTNTHTTGSNGSGGCPCK
jgi:hypothetical protein